MTASTTFEIRLADAAVEVADSLWAARHIIARRVAFAEDPSKPRDVLPAKIWKKDPSLFGGRAFVEEIRTAAELSANG
jgi:hypothetical protein